MRRFQPHDYKLRESRESQLFREAGFLISEDPEPYAADVTRDLLEFMREHTDTLRHRFSTRPVPRTKRGPEWGTEGPSRGQTGLGWIHASKMSSAFSGFLADEGLAQIGRGEDRQWVGLHPTMAAAYMLALVGACAAQDQLEPVTDNTTPRLLPTRGVEAAMRLLVDDNADTSVLSHRGYDTAGFAMLAIESVMPRNLAGVTVERILATKKALGEELTTFRQFIADQQPELARLAGIRSSEIGEEAFAAHLNGQVKGPLERLERGMRLKGFDTIRSLLTVQTVTPPAVLVYVADRAAAPPAVATVGAVGLVIGNAWWQLNRDRRQLLRQSPVGYLLSIKRALKARTVTERMATLLRHT